MNFRLIEDTIVVRPYSRWEFLRVREVWRYREFFWVLLARDIKVRYKQTFIGLLWIVIQPLLAMTLYTVIFGGFAGSTSYEALPYPVFALIGIVFWGYFSSSITYATSSLSGNAELIKKVYIPKEIFIIIAVATACIDFFVAVAILLIVLLLFHIQTGLMFYVSLFLGLGILSLSNLGLGLFLASCSIRFRDVRYLVPFFLQILFFTAPLIYPLERVTSRYQILLYLNPVTGVVELVRSALVYGTVQRPELVWYSVIFAAVVSIVGITYFRKTERDIVDVL